MRHVIATAAMRPRRCSSTSICSSANAGVVLVCDRNPNAGKVNAYHSRVGLTAAARLARPKASAAPHR
jgi:hypothetical protein